MKVKNRDLNLNLAGLEVLVGMDTPSAIGFRTKRLVEVLSKQAQTFYELRNKLIDKYAEKDEKGEPKLKKGTQELVIPDEHLQEFISLGDEEGDEVKGFKIEQFEAWDKEVPTTLFFQLGDLVEE